MVDTSGDDSIMNEGTLPPNHPSFTYELAKKRWSKLEERRLDNWEKRLDIQVMELNQMKKNILTGKVTGALVIETRKADALDRSVSQSAKYREHFLKLFEQQNLVMKDQTEEFHKMASAFERMAITLQTYIQK